MTNINHRFDNTSAAYSLLRDITRCNIEQIKVIIDTYHAYLAEQGLDIRQGWQPISEPPDKPMVIVLYTPSAGVASDMCDYSLSTGYYGGIKDGYPDWREQGTNHDVFESWRVEAGHVPTHWLPLPTPPMNEVQP